MRYLKLLVLILALCAAVTVSAEIKQEYLYFPIGSWMGPQTLPAF
jgi:hypothetical protein